MVSRLRMGLTLASILILVYLMAMGNEFHYPVYVVYFIGVGIVFAWDRTGERPLGLVIGGYAVFLLSAFATTYGWWSEIQGIDNWIHFFAHLIVGYAAALLWSRWLKGRYLILAVMATVVLAGFIIELIEAGIWYYFDISMAPAGAFYTDTIDDLLYDIAGGLVGLGLWWFTIDTKQE